MFCLVCVCIVLVECLHLCTAEMDTCVKGEAVFAQTNSNALSATVSKLKTIWTFLFFTISSIKTQANNKPYSFDLICLVLVTIHDQH